MSEKSPSQSTAEPHDPANGLTVEQAGNPCNKGCPGDWPCAERQSQRAELRRMAEYLHSDLYKRVALVEERTGGRWESHLGWVVWLGYGDRGLVGAILNPDGALHSAASWATLDWLECDLP